MGGGRRTPALAARPVIDARVLELHRRRRRTRHRVYLAVMAPSIGSLAVGAWGIVTHRGPGSFGFAWFALLGLAGVLVALRRLRPRLEDFAREVGGHPILQECPACGYPTISPDDRRCPECGATGLGRGESIAEPDEDASASPQ